MRFAGNYSNVGGYIAAGRAGAKGVSDAFAVARANAPDYGGIAETNMKARSAERVAATKAEAAVTQAGLAAMSDVKVTQTKADAAEKVADIKIDAKRKAGMVGALGAIAGGAFMGIENKAAAKRQAEQDAKEDARHAQEMAILRQSLSRESTYKPTEFDPDSVDVSDLTSQQLPAEGDDAPESEVVTDVQETQDDQTDEEPEPAPVLTTPTPTPAPTPTPSPTPTSTPPVSSQGLTGLDAQAAAIIRRVESGQYGYGAFNQGGKKDGHESINPGQWSKSKHSGGKAMTTLTVGEVLDRGKNHDNYTMFPTQQSYNDAGQLWAAGAYQFIPDTLADQVEHSGIRRDQLFSQEVQDQLFIDHARRNGNFQAWTGVANVTPQERKILDQWIAANR